MFKTLGYAMVFVGGAWIFVKVFNRSLDAEVERLDAFVRQQIAKAQA